MIRTKKPRLSITSKAEFRNNFCKLRNKTFHLLKLYFNSTNPKNYASNQQEPVTLRLAQGSSSADGVKRSKPGEVQVDRSRRCHWKPSYCWCPGSKLQTVTDSSIFCTLFWLWPSTPPGGGLILEQGPLYDYRIKIRYLIIAHYQPCLSVGLTSGASLFLSYVRCDMPSYRERRLLLIGKTLFLFFIPHLGKGKENHSDTEGVELTLIFEGHLL